MIMVPVFIIETDGGIHCNTVNPRTYFRLSFKTLNAFPDLVKDFLVQIVGIRGVIQIGSANPVNAGMIGPDQFIKILLLIAVVLFHGAFIMG